jgi:hypothetical protein
MKKVNLLICILYINSMFLIIINTYFSRVFIELILWLITKKEPDFTVFDDPSNFYAKLSIGFSLWFITYLVLSIINIISIIFDYKNNNLESLFQKMKRVKINLIPFWIVNFICYLPISAILLVAGHGFGFIIVPVFIFVSYTVLLLTSIFSILYLSKLRKNNILLKKQFIIHTILQFIFIADVIDVIYIIKKWGKPNVA